MSYRVGLCDKVADKNSCAYKSIALSGRQLKQVTAVLKISFGFNISISIIHLYFSQNISRVTSLYEETKADGFRQRDWTEVRSEARSSRFLSQAQ